MSRHRLTSNEIQVLQESLNTDYKMVEIRLREGEYQYALAKAIASFQLELYFPNVKDVIRTLYGEKKTDDVQFVRKIQTILKKMEKNNVIKILPKKRPWDLQRYAVSSFKFEDIDKNLIVFATEEQIREAQTRLNSVLNRQERPKAILRKIDTEVSLLMFILILAYAAILWNLIQPIVNPIIFVFAFSVAVACSLILGKMLS